MELNIDFNEASLLWRANKQYLENGNFKYICIGITKKQKQCLNKPLENCKFCHIHRKVNK